MVDVCWAPGGRREGKTVPSEADGTPPHAAPDVVVPSRAVTVPVIASGGVGTLDHLVAGIRDGHAAAVLAASIFHDGELTVSEVKEYLAARGVRVRRTFT